MKERIKEILLKYIDVDATNLITMADVEISAEEISKLIPQWIPVTEGLPKIPKYGEEVKIYPLIIKNGKGELKQIYATYNHFGVWGTALDEWEINPDYLVAWCESIPLPEVK